MAALISKGMRRKTERHVAVLGVDLRDAREEIFVRMVCDGLALGVAFIRAGFESKDKNAASNLFHLPRVQERAAAILEARRTTGVVSLGEVTDMLKRVYAGAHSEGEYSAAHNAAFSLARLYGHVTDRASIEVIRRPSRDPDAPSEQALSSWVEALPVLPGSGPAALGEASFMRLSSVDAGPAAEASTSMLEPSQPSSGPSRHAPADLLGPDDPRPEPSIMPSGPSEPLAQTAGPEPSELLNDINWLEGSRPEGSRVAGQPENGAPVEPVTGTPSGRARSELLGPKTKKTPTPVKRKRVPPKKKKVPLKKRGAVKKRFPKAEDLF